MRIRTISLTSSILSVLHRLCLRQPLFASTVYVQWTSLSVSDNADIQWWMDNMRLTSPLGIVVYMVIICLLTIIFSMVMLSPGRTADDLLKSGDSIQDIYAGKPTKRYLIGTVLSFSVISSIIICICRGWTAVLQFGGYVDASLAMLPCSIMMTTGLWISLYREAEVYRNMDRYHTFI